ncbi:uncharacterized protein LOC130897563 [Diorhabda carinulata]|uniref:uncharacterized protein LOC130897563 n=1 Tax=Diorhabda carinulata TaxID=1163345 RepID=UPI0025A0A554|nr:uncharacterized protein LOC130897563 [Diorhabda carinulata]
MAQGKLKVKTKLPQNAKVKKQKGSAVTKRANCPRQPKKQEVSQKLKQAVSKTVNKSVEDEIRARASKGPKNFSKAQEVVANHNAKTN